MHIFINDTLIDLVKPGEPVDPHRFNFILKSGEQKLTRANLIHHVWLQEATPDDMERLLKILEPPTARNLLSITITTEQYEDVKRQFKSHFKVIKAAGGVVRNGQKILMINRLKKWDLPKGKINKKEPAKAAAVREVMEECGVEVKPKNKICNTWHTYTMKRRPILKKTSWFEMKLLDDTHMAPQTEEDIEELRWMSPKEVYHALENSYRSIQYVVDLYYKMRKTKV